MNHSMLADKARHVAVVNTNKKTSTLLLQLAGAIDELATDNAIIMEALNIGAMDFCIRAGFDESTADQRVIDWIITARNRKEAIR